MIKRLIVLLSLFLVFPVFAKNGFDLSNADVPQHLIRAGGPPKDGIPAIDTPKFISAAEDTWLAPTDRVLGIKIGKEAKAYPIAILNWHEIVNDKVGGQSVVVSFCPLCGTGMVFDAEPLGDNARFGVSGLLFESDVLLYDQATESLWSQIWMTAITGPRKGEELTLLPSDHTSWAAWRAENPETKVLSRDTGFTRDYNRNPYANYEKTSATYFPVQHSNDALPAKTWVIGVLWDGHARAYDIASFSEKTLFEDKLGGEPIRLEIDPENQTGRAWLNDEPLPVIQSYWFAWYAFYPETELFKAQH